MNHSDLKKIFGDSITIIEGPQPDLGSVIADPRFETDPTNAFDGWTRKHLLDACGFIPLWIQDWLDMDGERPPLHEHLEHAYGYPVNWRSEGYIDSVTGLYTYPGDPVLHPYMRVEVADGSWCYQLPYGFVALADPKGVDHMIARMD